MSLKSKLKDDERKLGLSKEPIKIWLESRAVYDAERDIGEVIRLVKITLDAEGIRREVLINKKAEREKESKFWLMEA